MDTRLFSIELEAYDAMKIMARDEMRRQQRTILEGQASELEYAKRIQWRSVFYDVKNTLNPVKG